MTIALTAFALSYCPELVMLTRQFPVTQWGPEITDDPELSKRAHFRPFALGGTDNHTDSDNPKYWTLNSLMDLNGAGPDARSRLFFFFCGLCD